MSMMQCPECKKDISSHAVSCPHCGYPLKAMQVELKQGYKGNFGNITFILSIITIFLLLFLGGPIMTLFSAIISIVALILGVMDIINSKRLRLLNAIGLTIYAIIIGVFIFFIALM